MRTSDNLLLVDEDERHKVHFDMECAIIVHEFVLRNVTGVCNTRFPPSLNALAPSNFAQSLVSPRET